MLWFSLFLLMRKMLLFLPIVSPYVPLPSFDKAEPRKDADAGNLANVNKLLERALYTMMVEIAFRARALTW